MNARQEAADRREIADLVARYCRAIDRLELSVVADLYIPGGIDHHTGFDGPVEEFVDWLAGVLPSLEGSFHIIGTHLAEVHGDRAIAETYATAWHWSAGGDDPSRNFVSLVRYVDDLVRYDGRWRVRERWAVRERVFSLAGLALPSAAPGPRGSRDTDDPLAVLRARYASAAEDVR